MSDIDTRAAIRALERAGWRGLEPEQITKAADALMRERARLWLKHPGCKVRFSLAYSFGPDGEPLVGEDSVEVFNDATQAEGVLRTLQRAGHVTHCPVRVGLPDDRCACPGSPVAEREAAERARLERRCSFVGLDGLRCDLLDGHLGDCVLA